MTTFARRTKLFKRRGPEVHEKFDNIIRLENRNIDNVTFGITSFERPEHLKRLLSSIQKYYPNARVLIGDYSREHPSVDFGKLIPMEFDIGLSAARNVLAMMCQTKYFLLLEEDFVFTNETKIEPMVDVLECDINGEIGVVGGCLEMNGIHGFDLNLRKFRGKLISEKSPDNYKVTVNGTYYKFCDTVFNYSLFRTQMLQNQKFHSELKVGEHIPYYWEVKQKGEWRVAFTPDTIIGHDITGRSSFYNEYRLRARKLQQAWLVKNGITEYKTLNPIYETPKYIKNNIIILGVGHSGTTVLSRMLVGAGYNKNDLDAEFAESVSVRNFNDKIISKVAYNAQEQKTIIDRLQGPWVVKDPRFVFTLDKWGHVFEKNPPLLLYIQRDFEEVFDSHLRRNELPDSNAGRSRLAFKEKMARYQYSKWPWTKLKIKYEDLGRALSIFHLPETYHQTLLF